MSIPAAIAIRQIETIGEEYKSYVEPYAIAGEKFPARMDIFFEDKRMASIVCPPTTPETFEMVLSRLLWALATIGGTNINFVHRAEIAISSSLTVGDLEVEPTECMCVYDSSVLHITGLVFPFTRAEGSNVIDWGQSSTDHLPILEAKMLQVFLYNASQLNNKLGDPRAYIDWLIANEYTVEFYEPYTYENFCYDNI